MPSARFDADFQSFYDAVTQAEIRLKGFDSTTRQVEAALDQMVDSFTGRRVITEATLMSEAITRIGSPARLTASELQRVGAVAAEAAEKLRRLGEEVPPKLDRLASSAARARGEMQPLAASMRQFDGVLGSVGVNIGPQTRALEDLANASGKSAKEIGTLGTAGLITGAAIAGWKTGRAVAEFFDLDNIIGKATARLRGFGDEGAQVAGYKAEVLARASKNAGYAITDMAEAMKVNEAAAKGMIAANTKASDAAKQLAADDTKATAIMAANRGKLVTLEHELAVAQVARREADKAAYAQMAADSANAIAAAHADVVDAQRQEREGAAQLGRALQEADIASQQAQRKIADDATRARVALMAEADAANALARSLGNTIEYDLSTPGGRSQFERLNPGATFTGAAARPEYFNTHTLAEAVREGLVSYGRYTANSGPPRSTPGGAGATPYAPRTFLLEEVSNAIPAGSGIRRGDGAGIYAPVYVSGVFDPTSKTALSRAVSEGVKRAVTAGRH